MITPEVGDEPQALKFRLRAEAFGCDCPLLPFQSELPETFPRLGEFGIQGDTKADSPDRDDDGPGCGFSLGERSPQMGDHGSRLQPTDGGQLSRQVGADLGSFSPHWGEKTPSLSLSSVHALVFPGAESSGLLGSFT